MPVTWILVTVRDRMALTRLTLESLARHTPGDARLIVVDNGSREDTLDYLAGELKKGVIHRLVCNRAGTVPQWEKTYAINQAVDLLRTEEFDYFAWIDNDIEVRPGWLEAAQHVLSTCPEFAVCSMHNDELQEEAHKTLREEEVGPHTVRVKASANGALWVVRRSFFGLYGLPPVGLGLSREGAEDWYYIDCLKRKGGLFAVVDGYSVHQGYGDSLRADVHRALEGKKRLRKGRALKAGLGLVATSMIAALHQEYGAHVYGEPWRHWLTGAALAGMLAGAGALHAYARRAGRAALACFLASTAVIHVGVLAAYEGGYNSLLKNVLYLLGGSEEFLRRIVPHHARPVPDDAFFELTGVMMFVAGLVAACYAYRLLREREIGELRPCPSAARSSRSPGGRGHGRRRKRAGIA